jgi:hypothetical protein
VTSQSGQASLFDSGDARAVTERTAIDTECGFCAVLRGEHKVTLIHENDRIMSFLDHRALFRMPRLGGVSLIWATATLRYSRDL